MRSPHVVDVSHRALLMMEGTESLDLLHRISTNDFSAVPEQGVRHTILTNEKGRIIDKLTLLRMPEHQALIVCTSPDANAIKAWIEKFIIMEDIRVGIPKIEFAHLILFDAQDTQSLSSETDDPKSVYSELTIPSMAEHLPPVLTWKEWFHSTSLTHIFLQGTTAHALFPPLASAGISRADTLEYEAFRVAHGVPAAPNELSPAFNPLEARVTELVSFTKGCYIGQEVIARLDTYQKVQKYLVRFSVTATPTALPAPLISGDDEVGMLTSAVRAGDEVLGLGYLRSHLLDQDVPLCIVDDGNRIEVRVVPEKENPRVDPGKPAKGDAPSP